MGALTGNTFWGNPTNAGNAGSQIATTQAVSSDAQSSTITTTRTDLVGTAPIAFIRSRLITINVSDTKPNTTLYAFFDGVAVGHLMTQTGKSTGQSLTTDSAGRLDATFYIPPFTFRTGARVLRVQDTAILETGSIPGSMVGSASAVYTTQGTLETFKQTQDSLRTITLNIVDPPPAVVIDEVTTITVDRLIPAPADPLAQSFFTFGIAGGCFITSLDIYFSTKDTTLPVWVELREMVNGYPGSQLISTFARCTLLPAQVLTSTNSSLATQFVFDMPIYLGENKEYCFVLRSNSDKYHIFTSRLGERSIENNIIIFEQPHLGSMFKSQNNTTWTAEQSEDIKFTLNKAVFDTSSTTSFITYTAASVPVLIMGSNFLVTSGSNNVTVCTQHQHGLKTNDKINLVAKAGGVFRGITAASMTGSFTITYISEYVFQFSTSTTATSTGALTTPGYVNEIIVDFGGVGYNIADVAVVISGGVFTTAATAIPVIVGGVIQSITITNPGAGYTVAPTASITGSFTPGSEASVKLICESIFVLTTNNIVTRYQPQIVQHVPTECNINTDLITTSETYAVSAATRITSDYYQPSSPSILVSPTNAALNISASTEPAGTSVKITLASKNPNVSPIVVIREPAQLATYAYIINNQTEIESFTSINASASVLSGNMISGQLGSGYSSATVTIDPPHIPGGIQAVMTATVASGQITSLNVTTPGTGYLKIPKLTIIGNGTGALANATLSDFNSELLSVGGSARSKYLTKQFTLAQVSKGAQVTLTAISQAESNVDVYMRTSLTSNSLIHTELKWTKMACPVQRNLSSNSAQELDYVFTLDDLPPFDVYDLKLVLRSTNRMIIPTVTGYRCIILAT